jgi:long-chain acyl-CoA synthetase
VQKTATFLGHLGVGHGDSVVLWASNSPQWAMLFMACLYRGAVPVPADVGASLEFVSAITRQTEAKVVFRSPLREDPSVESPVLLMEDLLDDIRSLPPQEAPNQVRGEDIAQILFTSGTTGTPKGVVLTHNNIVANLKGIDETIVIDSDHLLISILPLSHIFEQSIGFWTPLIHGATVVHLQALKPSELFRALQRYPVTALVLVPQFLDLFRGRIQGQMGDGIREKAFQRMLAAADSLPWRVRQLLFFPVHRQIGSSFRFFVVGGAPLDPELERFWDRMEFLILQGYGLTEASPVVTLNSPDARKLGSVGHSLPGTEVAISDDGEVLVRGENVTTGYFKDPERTEETITNGRLHTEDLGYMDEEGFLFLKGRKKDLIVTPAGLNVYPEDVKAVFHRLPGVRDVAVLEFEDQVHAVLLQEHGANAGNLVEQANVDLAEHQRVESTRFGRRRTFPVLLPASLKSMKSEQHWSK